MHPGRREHPQQRLDRADHLAADPVAVDLHRGDARDLGQVRRRRGERGVDRQRGQVTHLRQRAHLDQLTGTQDRHPVAQRLDLAEDVRRQEDSVPPPPRLRNALAERLLHQRIQPAGRLIQDQQVGPRAQRGDQQHLLPVALGVGVDPLRRVQLEPPDQLVPIGSVDLAVHPAQQVQRLRTGQPRPQVRLTRHVGDPPVSLTRKFLRVHPEDLRAAGAGPDQPQQAADRRGLPGTIRPQVTQYLPLPHVQVQRPQRRRGTERLRQTSRTDRCHHQYLPTCDGKRRAPSSASR